jgi:hypothetical protein
MIRAALFSVLLALANVSTAQTQPAADSRPDPARDSTIRTVEQIKRADYEGDRAALNRLHAELAPPSSANKNLASRALYWRGFAQWRRAINGFNESVSTKEQEEDLNGAIVDFNDSLAQDPAFIESKIAQVSCYGYLAYLSMTMKDPARTQEYIQHLSPLLKEAMASDPDNPRLLWVLGPIRWTSQPESGGGQDKAFDLYNRGLDIIRKKPATSDPLEPSWGEPELLMNRAWSNLHRTVPDLKAAQQDADAALLLVPYWHYVRDILMPQIQDAQTKSLRP